MKKKLSIIIFASLFSLGTSAWGMTARAQLVQRTKENARFHKKKERKNLINNYLTDIFKQSLSKAIIGETDNSKPLLFLCYHGHVIGFKNHVETLNAITHYLELKQDPTVLFHLPQSKSHLSVTILESLCFYKSAHREEQQRQVEAARLLVPHNKIEPLTIQLAREKTDNKELITLLENTYAQRTIPPLLNNKKHTDCTLYIRTTIINKSQEIL